MYKKIILMSISIMLLVGCSGSHPGVSKKTADLYKFKLTDDQIKTQVLTMYEKNSTLSGQVDILQAPNMAGAIGNIANIKIENGHVVGEEHIQNLGGPYNFPIDYSLMETYDTPNSDVEIYPILQLPLKYAVADYKIESGNDGYDKMIYSKLTQNEASDAGYDSYLISIEIKYSKKNLVIEDVTIEYKGINSKDKEIPAETINGYINVPFIGAETVSEESKNFIGELNKNSPEYLRYFFKNQKATLNKN